MSGFPDQARALLNELLDQSGISERQLAKQAGVGRGTVSNIRSGASIPTLDTYTKMVESFGYSITLTLKPNPIESESADD